MHKRVLALAVIVLMVAMVTQVFAQTAPVYAAGDHQPISRAAAVAMLVEADPILKNRLPFHQSHTPPLSLFNDVDYSQWYAPYIETAFEAGIITGNDERLFRPDATLTQEEAIAIGARYQAMNHPELNEQIFVQSDSWFNGVVAASVQSGVKLPFPIKLGQPLQRAELYTMMRSMQIANPEQIAINNQPQPTPVVPIITGNPTGGTRPTYVATAVTPQPAGTPTPAAPTPAPAAPTSAPSGPQPSAKAFAITLPTLGITDLAITHPADPFTKDGLLAPLKAGLGHLFSYPGKGGKILIYGHSSSFPWDVSNYTKVFRQINKLSIGDKMYVTYGGKVHTYEVTRKQTVPADDMSVYSQAGGEEIILYTCWPPDSISQRYLVHAKPI